MSIKKYAALRDKVDEIISDVDDLRSAFQGEDAESWIDDAASALYQLSEHANNKVAELEGVESDE